MAFSKIVSKVTAYSLGAKTWLLNFQMPCPLNLTVSLTSHERSSVGRSNDLGFVE